MRKGFLPAPRRWWHAMGRPDATASFPIHHLLAPIVPLVLAAALVAPTSAGEWKGQRVIKDGVQNVLNPAEPMDPPALYGMRELWRLEDETPDGQVVFGSVVDAAFDSDGNVYLLDVQLKTIHVVSPGGDYLRSIGQEGEGPGDFRAPEGVLVTSDGMLGVSDDRPARVSLFTLGGTPAGAWRPSVPQGGIFIPFACRSYSSGYLLSCKTLTRGGDEVLIDYLLAAFDSSGAMSTVFWRRAQTLRRNTPINFSETSLEPLNIFSTDAAGCVYTAPCFSEYAIHVFTPEGTPRAVIRRDFVHVRRTPQEVAEMRTTLQELHRGWRGADIQAEPIERDIVDLAIRSDDDLWVQSSRSRTSNPPGTALVIDVFDRQGRYRRQAYLLGNAIAREDLLLVIDAKVIRVTASDVGVLESSTDSERPPVRVPREGLVAICYALEREE
jgi:hypothetical protein